MMMDQVTIDLGQKEFSSGLTFVALSCVRSFYGLQVLPFDLDHYKQIRSGKYIEARHEELLFYFVYQLCLQHDI